MIESNGFPLGQKPIIAPRTLDNEVRVPNKNSNENSKFSREVLLRQSPFWSRAILWALVGVTSVVFVWANIATIEEAIPTQGKLEPQGTVKEVQAPVAGVVDAVYVKDGQKVRRGDLLLKLDPTAARSQLTSLTKIRIAIIQENQFYRAQLLGKQSLPNNLISQLQLPPAIISLTQSRAALIAENQLYRTQLSGVISGKLSPEQEARLEFSKTELNTRIASDELQTEQLQKQIQENQVQLASAIDVRNVNQKILNDIEPLVKEGAIARLQYLKQQQEVRTRHAEVERLQKEQGRFLAAVAQSREKLRNTIVASKKELLTKISDNEKQVAQINSELNKIILENEKRVAEIDNQISQAQLNLRYQELRAPTDGIVFDLQARSTGFVTNPSQTILKIVPDEALTAKVYITNQDIGFVKQGMKVDVRIDSFPFSEFGDVKGEIVWIGSDALPPEEIRPYYSFPAKIRLEKQHLMIKNREVKLQSGMSLNANIKVRERTVMSIITDSFAKQIDTLKTVR